ncbi:DUF4383 domain-containing protein [Nonomuraea sp. NPDC049152]|uniref:DUF4383 domain-containing protein n=1 Tax=Nonomuraea sp. NPDC049152 TaxID=3154350 RepID=UPI0033C6D2C5
MFLLVGELGFMPEGTANHGEMPIAGHNSGGPLFGVFQFSLLDKRLCTCCSGSSALVMAHSRSGSRNYLIGGGVICPAAGTLRIPHRAR